MGFTVSEGRSQTPIRRVIADRLGQSYREAIHFSLNFDHRVVDGAAAARFLGVLAECLETGSPPRREKM